MKPLLVRDDLVYPELSYDIIGCAFEVYNELGPGHLEKFYQRSFVIALTNKKMNFKEQVYHNLMFRDKLIGKMYFDFLIDEKIIVELKKDNRFSKQHIDQVLSYLKVANLKLAILINFSNNGIIYKRVLNTPK